MYALPLDGDGALVVVIACAVLPLIRVVTVTLGVEFRLTGALTSGFDVVLELVVDVFAAVVLEMLMNFSAARVGAALLGGTARVLR